MNVFDAAALAAAYFNLTDQVFSKE